MKKYFLFSILVVEVFFTKAQALRLGSISLDAGAGIGIYGLQTHFPVEGYEVTFAGVLVSSLPAATAEFAITRWLGVGSRYRAAYYRTFTSNFIPGTDLTYRLTFYAGSKTTDKYNIQIGAGYGYTDFRYYPGEGHILAKGDVLNLHISPHFYPTKLIGFFFSVGFNTHMFKSLEYMDTDGTKYTEANDYRMSLYGVCLEFGLATRLHLLPNFKKEKKTEHETLSPQTITY